MQRAAPPFSEGPNLPLLVPIGNVTRARVLDMDALTLCREVELLGMVRSNFVKMTGCQRISIESLDPDSRPSNVWTRVCKHSR